MPRTLQSKVKGHFECVCVNVSVFSLCSLEQLSLKCCGLDDAFCAAICTSLSANHHLTTLDLSSNQISNEGVEHLATALRLNRTLLSLSLAGNRIGDEGVNALCQVCSIQEVYYVLSGMYTGSSCPQCICMQGVNSGTLHVHVGGGCYMYLRAHTHTHTHTHTHVRFW